MVIRCQERYDQVVEYAKKIGDTTFKNVLNASSNGKQIRKAGMKSICIMTTLRIHSDLRK